MSGRYEGDVYSGAGDLSPAWQGVRNVASKTAIFRGEKITPSSRNTGRSFASKTTNIRGESIFHSSSNTVEKNSWKPQKFVDGSLYTPTATREERSLYTPTATHEERSLYTPTATHEERSLYTPTATHEERRFYTIVHSPSTQHKKQLKNQTGHKTEDISDNNDLGVDYRDHESPRVAQNYVNPNRRSEGRPEHNVGIVETIEVKTCPWKKLSLFLLLTLLLASFIFLTIFKIDTRKYLNIFYFKSPFWKSPEIVEIPYFAERVRRIILNDSFPAEHIISVLAFGFLICVVFP